jgi:capsular polysaccharide biosynthesis protein
LSITDYLRILVRRGWIMVLLALIVGGTSYLLSRQQDPVYRASQTVLIQPTRADLGLAEASVRLTEPLTVYLNSTERAQEVIDELNLDVLAGELRANTTFASDQFRLTIQIDVQSESQDLAFRAARAWGQVLVDYRTEQNQLARREDRVEALLPDQPSVGQIAPRPTFNGIAGALLGLIVGAVIVFVLEYLESGLIRRREDLERTTELPTLATIPADGA